VNLRRREVELKTGYAEQAARGGADLGGKIGEGGDVVAGFGCGLGELGSGQLHAIA